MTRVLIADDEPDVAALLAELVTVAAPFPVEIAIVSDGRAALAKAVMDLPDCAILDIDMPNSNGIAAAVAIRSALGEHAPLLIALTGDPRHEHARDARAFDHFLFKPADIDGLVRLVGSAPPRV